MLHRSKAWLGACAILAPLVAFGGSTAADAQGCAGPAGTAIETLPPTVIVRTLPEPAWSGSAPGVVQVAGPAAQQMIVQADAFMREEMAEMRALTESLPPLPSPSRLIEVLSRGFSAAPAAGSLVTELNNGIGSCSEMVTYTYPARGRPVVRVTTSGNACGMVHLPVPVASPAPHRSSPWRGHPAEPATDRQPHLLTVTYEVPARH